MTVSQCFAMLKQELTAQSLAIAGHECGSGTVQRKIRYRVDNLWKGIPKNRRGAHRRAMADNIESGIVFATNVRCQMMCARFEVAWPGLIMGIQKVEGNRSACAACYRCNQRYGRAMLQISENIHKNGQHARGVIRNDTPLQRTNQSVSVHGIAGWF